MLNLLGTRNTRRYQLSGALSLVRRQAATLWCSVVHTVIRGGDRELWELTAGWAPPTGQDSEEAGRTVLGPLLETRDKRPSDFQQR